jgi:ATP-dependent helicase/DNAse subunit B
MPLTLITGPANAGKAGRVLDAYRAALDREPLLVVPTLADVAHYQRELATAGVAFGGTVVRFARLVAEIARRTGWAASVLGPVQRDRMVAAAIARSRLDALAASARSAGFPRAAAELFAELQRGLVTPDALRGALASAGGGRSQQRYGAEVAALYEAYRTVLDAAGAVDGDLFAWRALDALRAHPRRWGGRPVFVYGFDDFTGLELAVLRALADDAGAEVTVAVTFEPGREAFAGRTRTHEGLAAIAAEEVSCAPRDEHYAPGSRAALHHLERSLFEAGAPSQPAGDAVRVLEAGGARAELELVAAEVLEALADGTPPDQVAIVFRDPRAAAPLAEQVLADYGVPFELRRSAPLAHTSLGRGLLALLRAAGDDGRAEDLLAYVRTPGRIDVLDLADRLEEELRREGVTSAAEAAARWPEVAGWPLDELDQLRRALRAGPEATYDAVEHRAEALLTRPRRRRAALLAPEELPDARVYAVVRKALGELRQSAGDRDVPTPSPAELHDALAELEVDLAAPAGGGVAVLSPLDVRARRFRRVYLCGLQEGEFPRRGRPEPFLTEEVRAELGLPARDDVLAGERVLFHAAASRAEERLTLSWRSSDEEGNPALPSSFLEDVGALFDGDVLAHPARRRALADVTWPVGEAPTPAEAARSRAAAAPRVAPEPIAPLRSPAVLARLAEAVFSPSALEVYVGCPVRWLVERRLGPARLEPEAEPLVRGRFMHQVLDAALTRLRGETGSARVRPATLARAKAIVGEEIDTRRETLPLSTHEPTARAAMRRLELDLDRYLEYEAAGEGWEPEHLELRFGFEDADHGQLEIGGGELRVRGTIDRVEVDGARAVVRDYKSSVGHPYAKWADDGILQVGLYLLAVQRLLGLTPAAGLYQPLRGDLRARGLVRRAVAFGEPLVATDLVDDETFERSLEEVETLARDTARRLRAGELTPNPDRCAFRGGCAHPGICRSVGA